MTYQQWLAEAVRQLQQTKVSDSAKLDAQLLLQFVTGKDRAYLLAFAERQIEEKYLPELTALLQRRLQGEPVAYILGEKEFWSLPLFVSKHTLIPRPDTEILVEKALQGAQQYLTQTPKSMPLRILDLGTGTGAIALALASELSPLCEKQGRVLDIWAVDLIPQAVALAKRNAQRHQLKVNIIQSYWFNQLNPQTKFNFIVANPPYIEQDDKHLQQGDVRFEPRSALVAEQQGLADLGFIIEQAPPFLQPNGWLLLEHGWQQAEQVRHIFQQNHWHNICTVRDYGNNERVTLACLCDEKI